MTLVRNEPAGRFPVTEMGRLPFGDLLGHYMRTVLNRGVVLICGSTGAKHPLAGIIEKAFGGGTGFCLLGWNGLSVFQFEDGTRPEDVANALLQAAETHPALHRPSPEDVCDIYENGEMAIRGVFHGHDCVGKPPRHPHG